MNATLGDALAVLSVCFVVLGALGAVGAAFADWLRKRRQPRSPREVIDELAHRRALRDARRTYFDQHRIGRRQ